ncbi:MAG: ATP-grasp fold amidoligase family protein [Thermodesulfobacteriota bacterium]
MKTSREIVQALYNQKLPRDPRTFTEKLRWKMKYDRRPILTLTADKFGVMDYLRQNGFGNLLKKLYFVTDKPGQIPFDDLPGRYIIKSSHSSGDIIIMDNGFDLVTKAPLVREDQIAKCSKFLRRRHWNELNEWAYRGIKPVILVEEFLSGEEGLPPVDFKFLCFDGKAEIVEVIEGRYGEYSDNYFDMDWNPLRFTWSDWPGERGCPPKDGIQKPPGFGEMVRVAEELSRPFDFVRVDLYNVSGRIYFGEFTHYPSGGIGEIEPRSFDDYIGSLWTLPDIKTVRDNSFSSFIKEAYYNLRHNYKLVRYK